MCPPDGYLLWVSLWPSLLQLPNTSERCLSTADKLRPSFVNDRPPKAEAPVVSRTYAASICAAKRRRGPAGALLRCRPTGVLIVLWH